MRFFIEQLALAPTDPGRARRLLERMGMQTWVEDTVRAAGFVDGAAFPSENVANLSFNYESLGDGDQSLELEILEYTEGPAWIDHITGNEASCVSHLGMHCSAADLEHWKAFFAAEGIRIEQEVTTLSHTNPAIAGKRSYVYCIFGTRDVLGTDLKLIVRTEIGT